jgi:hypothetical protein
VPAESRVEPSAGGERAITAALFLLAAGLGVASNATAASTASPEQAVIRAGALCAAAGVVLLALWFHSRNWRLTIDVVSFGVFAVTLTLLVAAYFTAELRAVLYRADFLIWSESPFVNDIIKFRSGGTLYGTPSNFDSFNYTPGAPLLTWGLASLVGMGDSIPAYRVIQVLMVVLATAMGVRTISLIRALRGWERPGLPWTFVWFPLLFLAATNGLTNKFNHLLHNDALGLLVCVACFLVLVEHAVRPRTWLLVAMVLLPAAGFLTKQSLGIWCVLFGAWLLLFDRPFRFWRAFMVGGSGLALILALYAGGIAIWGADFQYWVIEGLGKHTVSPLRSIQHALDGWMYWAVGLWGGMVLLRGERASVLLGLWLVWGALFALETYTSGIAWMLNHMGPGSFLAVVWLAAALPSVWPTARAAEGPTWLAWLRTGAFTALAIFALSGLSAIRVPITSLPRDADRYVSEIEREFEGKRPETVLLDNGSWVYVPAGVVQKDRSSPAGEAGWTGTADFGPFFERIRTHYYDRILLRELHGDEFMYDYSLWEKPSGVRDSLLHYYRETRVIPGVAGLESVWLRSISILEPVTSDSTR